MQSPLASIVVPTFNQAEYLAACLDSIMFQEYEHLEIIVVNDGSPDHTAKVLEHYQYDVASNQVSFASRYKNNKDEIERVAHPRYPQKGRNLSIITHEKNLGLAAALNTGFRACTGVYCTYVPSDDICFPHMIKTLVNTLETHNADFVYSDMFIHDDKGRIVRRFSLPDYSYQRCFCDWYLCGVAKLYRRQLHERFGYYDENLLAHDHDMFQRFAVGGAEFVHVPQVLMSLLSHDGDRQIDIHSDENWNRLLEESKCIIMRARELISK